jgi:hypothetical protein
MKNVDRRDFITNASMLAAVGMVGGFDLVSGQRAAVAKDLDVEEHVNVTKLLMEAGLKFAQPFPSKEYEAGKDWTAIWTDPCIRCTPSLDNVCDKVATAVETLARQALFMVAKAPAGTWKTITTPTVVANPMSMTLGERADSVEFHAFIHLGQEEPDASWVHRRMLRSVRSSRRD